ncbi:hypothetical protein C8R43DRAFT_986687 [Mycena crocata]|nr:hypothetical protein C8R43DRAFT_986687 [Mycena crocata]
MDIPSMVVQLQREIRALPARAAPSHAPRVLAAPSLPANPPSSSHGAIARGRDAQPKPGVGTKRVEREFSPEGAPAAKQQKPLDDFFLVYMWEVKLEKVAPIMWARKALKATGVELSALKNAIHPKNMAKGLISIRFKSHDAGQRFLSRMQNNPPRDMAHLHVATPEAYGKRREQDVPDEDDLSW